MKIIAIIAHYEVNAISNKNFKILLEVLEKKCDSIIIISTAQTDALAINFLNKDKFKVIYRPNIGYDFYSYKVGFNSYVNLKNTSKIFFINSSFFISDKDRFINAINLMQKRSDDNNCVALTSSHQISFHLQSYLFLLGKNVFNSNWFHEFIDSINPKESKFEIIYYYEVGFSKLLKNNKIRFDVIYSPTFFTYLKGKFLWLLYLFKTYRLIGLLKGIPFFYFKDANPLYYFAGEIERKYGLIKVDYFREKFLKDNNAFSHLNRGILLDMQSYILGTNNSYKKNSINISELSQNKFLLASLAYGESNLKNVNVAVVVHIHYEDLIYDIYKTIRNIIEPMDIFVTTSNEALIKDIVDSFSSIANSVTVYLVRNRGRDIEPFIYLYKKGVLDRYTCVLKIHSKKSKYHTEGEFWRQQIYQGLIENSSHFLEIYNNFMTRKIGMMGIRDFYLTHNNFWGANKSRVNNILNKIKTRDKDRLEFFAGSMFWFNPKAFELINSLPDEIFAFEEESGLQDSTLAHAFERIFCNIARKEGYEIVATDNYKKLDPNEKAYLKNNVPVL